MWLGRRLCKRCFNPIQRRAWKHLVGRPASNWKSSRNDQINNSTTRCWAEDVFACRRKHYQRRGFLRLRKACLSPPPPQTLGIHCEERTMLGIWQSKASVPQNGFTSMRILRRLKWALADLMTMTVYAVEINYRLYVTIN